MKNKLNKISKLLLAFGMFASQMLIPSQVFADTLTNNNTNFSVVLNSNNTITVTPIYSGGDNDMLSITAVEKFQPVIGVSNIIKSQTIGNNLDNIITKSSITADGQDIILDGYQGTDIGKYLVEVTVQNLTTSTSLGTIIVDKDIIGINTGLKLVSDVSGNILAKDAINKVVNISAFVLPGGLSDATSYTATNSNDSTKTITGNRSDVMFYNFGSAIDFTNKLYGSYNYDYAVEISNIGTYQNTININYGTVNDNDSVLNTNDLQIEFNNGNAIFYGVFNNADAKNVGDIKTSLNKVYLGKGYTIVVKDQNSNVINNDTSVVTTGMKIEIQSTDLTISYNVIVKSDYKDATNDYNGVVETNDINNMLNTLTSNLITPELTLISDVNNDTKTDVLDLVKTLNSKHNNNWIDVGQTITDIISGSLNVANSIIRIGDTIEVKYDITGLSTDYINGIQGVLNYDDTYLTLTSVNSSKSSWLGKHNNLGNHVVFMYAGLDNIDNDQSILTFSFDVIKDGNTTVSLDNLSLVKDDAVILNNTNCSKDLTIAKQDNNNLKSLIVEGYNIDFSQDNLIYEINVGNDINSLDLQMVTEDLSATVQVFDNENFKEGKNVVTIIVTAADGTPKTYTIVVNKNGKNSDKTTTKQLSYIDSNKKSSSIEENDDSGITMTIEKEKEKPNEKTTTTDNESNSASKIIIIILILLVIGGLLYLIFKEDEPTNKIDHKKK